MEFLPIGIRLTNIDQFFKRDKKKSGGLRVHQAFADIYEEKKTWWGEFVSQTTSANQDFYSCSLFSPSNWFKCVNCLSLGLSILFIPFINNCITKRKSTTWKQVYLLRWLRRKKIMTNNVTTANVCPHQKKNISIGAREHIHEMPIGYTPKPTNLTDQSTFTIENHCSMCVYFSTFLLWVNIFLMKHRTKSRHLSLAHSEYSCISELVRNVCARVCAYSSYQSIVKRSNQNKIISDGQAKSVGQNGVFQLYKYCVPNIFR